MFFKRKKHTPKKPKGKKNDLGGYATIEEEEAARNRDPNEAYEKYAAENPGMVEMMESFGMNPRLEYLKSQIEYWGYRDAARAGR